MDALTGQAALSATQSVTEAARDALEQARAHRDELLVLASHEIGRASCRERV